MMWTAIRIWGDAQVGLASRILNFIFECPLNVAFCNYDRYNYLEIIHVHHKKNKNFIDNI